MPAFRIIEAFDVVAHVSLGLVMCPIGFASCSLGLERREEALHRGVVPNVARTAHRAEDAMIGQQLLELLAGVLRELKWWSQRSDEGGCDETCKAAFGSVWPGATGPPTDINGPRRK